jgi:hypothetical protein
MPKICEIRVDRTKNLGQYENLKLGFTAVIHEDENPTEAIERVTKLLDWEINLQERERNHAIYSARLDHLNSLNGTATEKDVKEKDKIERWFERFDRMKDEIDIIKADFTPAVEAGH